MDRILDFMIYAILALVCFYAAQVGYEAGEAFKLMVSAQ